MAKEVILTGIRANNELHIGNYFGALLPIVDMATKHANDYEVNLMVADLHSFTTPIDHTKLQTQIMENLRVFVAAGLPLNHPNIRVFRQSYVPAHSELTWILDCFTGVGQMSRMTEFKDKSKKVGEDQINVGLFNYPVLMACDVLLYNTLYVPVGDDQRQHLEFIRDTADRMNSRFNQKLFVVPKSVDEQHKFFKNDQGLRIKDLVDPSKKMSKSDDTGRGVIFLNDGPEEATKKIMSATTDSLLRIPGDENEAKEQPGVSNLMLIKALLTKNMVLPEGNTQGYAYLKEQVAKDVKNFLEVFQAKLGQVDDAKLMSKLETDEATMNETANETLLKVQKAVGLRPKT